MTRDVHDTDRPLRDEEGLKDRLREYLPELVRRTLSGGLGALFATEEGIRRIVQEAHIPKEVASYLLEQAQATKREVYRILANELREWLEKVDLENLLLRVLTSLTFEIRTQVRLMPNEDGLIRPVVKPRIRVRRDEEGGKDDAEVEKGGMHEQRLPEGGQRTTMGRDKHDPHEALPRRPKEGKKEEEREVRYTRDKRGDALTRRPKEERGEERRAMEDPQEPEDDTASSP